MLRIFQTTLILLGGFLILIPLAIQQRDNLGPLQQIVVMQYTSPNGLDYYYNLWLLQPESGRRVQLVHAWATFEIIGWASDGALIYVEGGNDQTPMLMRVEANGKGRQQLVSQLNSTYGAAAWLTPNRERVVYLDFEGATRAIRTDGRSPIPLSPGYSGFLISPLVVSPDSTWVAFRLDNLRRDLFVARLDGTELRVVSANWETSQASPLAWLPFGSGLVVADATKLAWVDLPTATLVPLTTLPLSAAEQYWGANATLGLVYVLSLDQRTGTRSFQAIDAQTHATVWSIENIHNVEFSPNTQWGLAETDAGDWLLMDAATGATRPLQPYLGNISNVTGRWSPDSQSLILSGHNDLAMEWELWRWSVATADMQRIWHSPEISGDVLWSADSRRLFLHRYTTNGEQTISLDPHTSHYHVVTDSAFYGSHHVEDVAPPIPKHPWSKSGLRVAGVALIALGLAPALIRLRAGRYQN